jgi:transposase-like protein
VPARVPDDEREQIIAEFATGKSCRQIAKQFGRATQTISNIARDAGHSFGQTNAEHARAVKAVYDSERRARIIANELEAIERLQAQRFAETLVYNFGGRENTYNEHMIAEPDFRSKRDLTAAISTAVKTVMELDRAEQANSADELLIEFTTAIRKRREARDDDDGVE